MGIIRANDLVVADKFGGDFGTIAAAAERGDAQAQLAMLRKSCANDRHDDVKRWGRAAVTQDNADALLWKGVAYVDAYLTADETNDPERDALSKKLALDLLKTPAASGSATAQYALGMLIYCSHLRFGCKG
jgi:TPR repeat protein